jgi:glutamate-ammonia-ligase adenylyltransferase
VARYEQHSAAIRIVYKQYLGDKEPETTTPLTNTPPLVSNLLPHLARMPLSYITAFSEAEIEYHATLVEQLDQDNLVKVEAKPLDQTYWEVTLVGYDYLGQLSLICGLLFVYGFNIVDGKVFSYGPAVTSPASTRALAAQRHRRKKRSSLSTPTQKQDNRRKIVDVFTVRPVQASPNRVHWQDYADDLNILVKSLHENKQREAQGKLAKRVAVALRDLTSLSDTLYPIDIEIDNESSERHTVLRIKAPDTIGFLYEFTNALALHGINIRGVTVNSVGNWVQDTLYVTDTQRNKITAPRKQRELRVATALIKHFTHLLPQSPNPELALLHFREFVGQLFTRPDWPDEMTSLEKPEVLNTLARLLGVSDFLWNDFLRMQYENLFPVVRDTDILAVKKSKTDLQAELETLLQQTPPGQPQREALNAFKDREMFRIDMRQIQGYLPGFGQFSDELTDLAEVVVEAAYHLAGRDLRATFGLPRMSNGRSCPVSVCGLGKCGGRELGFASDIELMFLYADNGKTTGPRVITTAEFFNKLVQEVNYIIQARQEGIFELDLRLRPYGKAGNMAVSLDSFRRYFTVDGDAWPYERQALVRLRPIAGDEKFGREVVKVRDALIYTGDPFDVAAMRAMRERQWRHLVTAGTINAKFSPGGLVDVEYLVQGLQISHGHRLPALRQPNIHEAMQALVAANILAPADYLPLKEAHIFLRRLINALRMVRGDAKELTVPSAESEEFAFLARRLDYGSDQIAHLWDDLIRHTTTVQEINSRLLR